MMKKETNKQVSVLVFMKAQHKYTDSEKQLETLCKEKYDGRDVGGGTNLSNGKRDRQFIFNKKTNAKAFLRHPFTKAVILKDYDLVELD
jgi:ribosomal protein L15E